MMVTIGKKDSQPCLAEFYKEDCKKLQRAYPLAEKIFSGKYLQSKILLIDENKTVVVVGMGKEEDRSSLSPKELLAKACKELKSNGIRKAVFNIENIVDIWGIDCISACTEGIHLGFYDGISYKQEKEKKEYQAVLCGISEEQTDEAQKQIEEGELLAKAVIFVRELVNMPGNMLRPLDFAKEVSSFAEHENIEISMLTFEQLLKMGMGALAGIGGSSEFPPCMCVLRYMGNPDSDEVTGLIGKGVTSDTGGYCLKGRASLIGMNGDMAGGAVTAAVIKTLAEQKVKVNVVCVIPMCENRISPGSMLPGDVISSYSGRTIEILNTDAEGRLILADAVSYAVKDEKVTRILDIATLTGAMVNALGFHVTGALSDSDEMWTGFEEASYKTGEHFCRLPYYKENEKMIESSIADVKNMGETVCGSITAGLFIRKFAEEIPWIHLDIAGTASVDKPLYEFQSKGATGAAVDTIYRWLAD